MILDTITEMLEQCDASDVPNEVETFARENNVEIVLGAGDANLFFRGVTHKDVCSVTYNILYISLSGEWLCGRYYPCPCCDFKNMAHDIIKAEYNNRSSEWDFETKLDHCKVSVTSTEEGTRYGIAYVLP